MKKSKRNFIIAGINGEIGSEFAKRLQDFGNLYGISRKENKVEGIKYEHLRGDLLIDKDVERVFSNLDISGDLTYIHLPGKFQFQDENHPITDKNNDGIDDETFATNVETFSNIKPYLLKYLEKNPKNKLKIIAIGSTSDLYDIPYWHSFTHSKNELRKEFRSVYGNLNTYGRVSSLFINVSTVDGSQLAGERPYISKEFTLNPEEILNESLYYILDDKPSSLEISVLKPNPDFEKDFLNIEKLKKRWYGEMYIDNFYKRRVK